MRQSPNRPEIRAAAVAGLTAAAVDLTVAVAAETEAADRRTEGIGSINILRGHAVRRLTAVRPLKELVPTMVGPAVAGLTIGSPPVSINN